MRIASPFQLACCLLLGVLICRDGASAQDESAAEKTEQKSAVPGDSLSPPITFIVTAEQAAIMAGNERISFAPRGTVVEATRLQGNWRFAPDFKGWVHLRDLVSTEEAVDQFTRQIEKQPTPEAYHLRGIAWMSRQDWSQAQRDLEKAFQLGEDSVLLHFNIGVCFRELGETQRALSEFHAILDEYPDEFTTYVARGQLFLESGNNEAALADFDRALELQPAAAHVHNHRGVTLRLMGRFQEALEEYDRAIELRATFPDAYANRAFVQKSLKNFDAAKQDYEQAYQQDPDSVEIQNDFAWLLATCPKEDIRDSDRAVALAEAACESTDSRQADLIDTLGAAYASQGEYARAVEAARLALSLMENDPRKPQVEARLKRYQAEEPYRESP